MQERRPVTPLIGVVAAGVVALDQLAKWVVLRELDGGRVVDVVGSLRLRLVFNQGLAFGLGSRFTSLIALGAVAVVLVLLRNRHRVVGRVPTAALGLVVGGAVGNLLDRLLREGHGGLLGGAVVDFVDLQWWPVFNLADVAITVGAVLLALTAGREPSSTAAGPGSGSGAGAGAGADPAGTGPEGAS
ncbi:MAG: signal peptidase II [Acidimicrobiia bacterium]